MLQLAMLLKYFEGGRVRFRRVEDGGRSNGEG